MRSPLAIERWTFAFEHRDRNGGRHPLPRDAPVAPRCGHPARRFCDVLLAARHAGRVSCPALESARECGGFRITEQASDVRHRKRLVTKVEQRELVARL